MSYRIEYLFSGQPGVFQVNLVFDDGTEIYGRSDVGYDDAVESVMRRVEEHGGPAEYAAYLRLS